jgi:transposase
MRGEENRQEPMFHYFSVEDRIGKEHPIRRLRHLCDEALGGLSCIFDGMYSEVGRPSIAPETLLKSTILMALYSVRSENQFCEQLNYNMLFRWFLGMDMSIPAFDRTVFSKNRQRLLEHEVGQEFLKEVVEMARARKLLSEDHFTVDGTLIESWASLKSFHRKGKEKEDDGDSNGFMPRNPDVDFHGEKRSNKTHESRTDPEARLAKKGPGKEAKLAYCANVVVENRNGLVVECELMSATGTAEVESAITMIDRLQDSGVMPRTVGADKSYHAQRFVSALREREIKPHVAPIKGRKVKGLDGRTTTKESYRISQRKRKLVEQCFGFAKTVGGLRKSRLVGTEPTNYLLTMTFATLNLLRIAKLSTA